MPSCQQGVGDAIVGEPRAGQDRGGKKRSIASVVGCLQETPNIFAMFRGPVFGSLSVR